MFMPKAKAYALVLLLVATLGAGGSLLTERLLGNTPAASTPAAALTARTAAAAGREESERRRPEVTGRITAIAKDGKTITLETAPGGRGEPARTAEINLTANSKLLFSGVGIGGAKLTVGYGAQVWLAASSKDTAERMQVLGNVGLREGPQLAGPVLRVTQDGKRFVVKLAPRGRDDAGKGIDVQLDEKTHVLYSNIGKGGARPTDGYSAAVWYKKGTRDTVAKVVFAGNALTRDRGTPEPRPDAMGKVVAVTADTKGLTLELPPRERGGEPGKLEIRLTGQTTAAYYDVGPGGAQPTDGYLARVWFADGSKDTASKVLFQGVPRETPVLRGKVTGIGKGGMSITLEVPGQERGETRTVPVKFGPNTKVVFQGVGPDGALLSEGFAAQVTLEEGSTEVAAHVLLMPAPVAGERPRRE